MRYPFLAGLALAAIACSNSPTAVKPRPHPDPYEIVYVVDDLTTPIDTVHITFHLTDSTQGVFDYQEQTTLDTLASHAGACFPLSDTLGQRLVSVTASTDTGVVLHYQLPSFDPAAGVDTTGGAGMSPASPWIWRWKIGDSTVTGFPRPASWQAKSFCEF